MAGEFVDLKARLSLSAAGFVAETRKAVAAARNVGDEFEDAVGDRPQGAIKDTGKEVKKATWVMRGHIKDLSRVITGILMARGFYQLLRTIGQLKTETVDFMKTMETMVIQFQYLLGTTDEIAQQVVRTLEIFSAETPFRLDQSTEALRRFLAAGWDLRAAFGVMQGLVDAAAATGLEFNVLANVIADIKTMGVMATRELRRLQWAGIPAGQILMDQLGLSREDLRDLSKLNIPADVAIAALLRGFTERYEGAAYDLELTAKGLVTTIKDFFLSMMNEVFDPWYVQYKDFLERIMWGLRELREGVIKYGPAFLLAKLVPPQYHASIRSIIAGFILIGRSVKDLYDALKPLLQVFGELAIRGLGILAPIIAGLVRAIVNLVQWASQASPVIRILVSAITGLFVASLITAWIVRLVAAIRWLYIATGAAKAVLYLARAFKVLTAASTVLYGKIALVIAAIVALALALGTIFPGVGKWVDNMLKKIWGLFDINFGEILQPKELEEAPDLFGEVGDALEEVGDEAEEAGKKVDKLFLAAFDEVYPIPDAVGAAGKSLDDMMREWPDATLPDYDVPGGASFGDLFDGWDNEFGAWEGSFFDWWNEFWGKVGLEGLEYWMLIKRQWGNFWGTMSNIWDIWKAWFFKSWEDTWEGLQDTISTWRGLFREGWELLWLGISDIFETWKFFFIESFRDIWTGIRRTWDTWAGFFRRTFERFWSALKQTWETLLDWDGTWSGLWETIRQIWEIWSEFFKGSLKDFWSSVKKTWDTWTETLQRIWDRFWGSVTDTWDTWRTTSRRLWENFWNRITDTVEIWGGVFSGIWEGFWEAIKDTFEEIRKSLQRTWLNFWVYVEGVFDIWGWDLNVDWIKLWGDMEGFFIGWKERIGGWWSDFWQEVQRIWDTTRTNVGNTWNTFWSTTLPNIIDNIKDSLKGKAAEAFGGISESWSTFRTNLSNWWSTFWTITLPNTVSGIKQTLRNRVNTAFAGLVEGWSTFRTNLSNWWSTFWNTTLPNVVSGLRNTLKNRLTTAFRGLFDAWNEFRKDLRDRWDRFWANLPIPKFNINIGGDLEGGNLGSGLENGVRPAVTRVKSWLEGIIEQWNNLRFGVTTSTTGNTVTTTPTYINPDSLARVGRMARGGVVDRATLAWVGEGRDREAVIPLNKQSLQPFAEVLAEQIGARSGGAEGQPTVYVGTLIASDQSLRELERRMKVVRIQEQHRVGGLK